MIVAQIVAAYSEQINITGISIVRIANNRLVERWQNWDMLALVQLIYNVKLAVPIENAGSARK